MEVRAQIGVGWKATDDRGEFRKNLGATRLSAISRTTTTGHRMIHSQFIEKTFPLAISLNPGHQFQSQVA
jgi:hypothetical protein